MGLIQNSKIQGNYIINFPMKEFTQSFTFAGNNRHTYLNPSSTVQPAVYWSSGSENHNIKFLTNNVLKIKRAKIVTLGAEGLRAGFYMGNTNGYAAAIQLIAARSGVTTDDFGKLFLKFLKFNEWTDFNYNFKCENLNEDSYNFNLSVSSVLCVDDYNIQSKYIGETFFPILVLDIDTAGIIDPLEPNKPL